MFPRSRTLCDGFNVASDLLLHGAAGCFWLQPDLAECRFVLRDVLLQHIEKRLRLLRAEIDALEVVNDHVLGAAFGQRAEGEKDIPEIRPDLDAVGVIFPIFGEFDKLDFRLSRRMCHGEAPSERLQEMAGTTGLEPATSDVTGRRSNQLNYVPDSLRRPSLHCSMRSTTLSSGGRLLYSGVMADDTELVTIFRSADLTADDDAAELRETLLEQGLHPTIVRDDVPGVVTGTVEVRVPRSEVSEAETIVADSLSPAADEVNPSHTLDQETVFSATGTTAEMEATNIKAILDANGIESVLVGSSSLPTLPFEVQVARDHVERARQVIDEARAAGPAAAEEAEQATEQQQ